MPGDDLSPIEIAMGREVFARYQTALTTLSDAEQEAVIGRLELGCTYQEIAAILDAPSADAARMSVTRALAKLARCMADR